jgi:hypothetical protein
MNTPARIRREPVPELLDLVRALAAKTVLGGKTVCSAERLDNRWRGYIVGGKWVWEGSDRGGIKQLEFTPTHWMPLPEPPAS